MENFLLIKKKEDNNLETTDLLYMDKNQIVYEDVELLKLFNGCHFFSKQDLNLSLDSSYSLMCENSAVVDQGSFCQFTTYMNGRPNGLCEIYYATNSFSIHSLIPYKLSDIYRVSRGYYNNGKKHGVWKEYYVKTPGYFLNRFKHFHSNRFIDIFSNFIEDENDYTVRSYHTFHNDVLEGLTYIMGDARSEIGYYKNGKKEGLWKDFNSLLFRNNKKLEINNLNDEEIDNFLRTNKDPHAVVQEWNYLDGIEEGESKQIWKDQIQIKIFKNGKVVKEISKYPLP